MLSLALLFALALSYFKKSLYINKHVIDLKSEPFSEEYYKESHVKPKRVICLLFDSLREDQVRMDEDLIPFTYLDRKNRQYQYRQVQLFNDLLRREPDNTILVPMQSEMPTTTVLRAQGSQTGALNAYIDMKDNFESKEVTEDSTLYQLHKRNGKRINTTSGEVIQEIAVFAGDYLWMGMFGSFFNRSYPHESLDASDLDGHDVPTAIKLLKEARGRNFTFL